jgi:hypothetical protein
MKTHVRDFCRNVTATIGRIRAASRPVKATVGLELAAGLVVALVAWGRLRGLVGGLVDLAELPPWWLLVAGPVVGAATAALRAWRPDEALRRWHGVALRRIDERFG